MFLLRNKKIKFSLRTLNLSHAGTLSSLFAKVPVHRFPVYEGLGIFITKIKQEFAPHVL